MGAIGALSRTGWRFVVLLCLIALGFLLVKRPDGAFLSAMARWPWSWPWWDFGPCGAGCPCGWTRVCHIHVGGLAVTGLFGQVKHVVLRGRITVLKHMSNLTSLLSFHRFELVLSDAEPVAVLVLKMKPESVPALRRVLELGGVRQEG